MPYRTTRRIAALLLAACAPAAWAGDDVPEARLAAARALFRPENAIGAREPARPAAHVLAQQRGGADSKEDSLTAMRLDGRVVGNTAVDVVSGANSISAGSFANMAGIPVVIQNSGANVLIQSATIINLQFK